MSEIFVKEMILLKEEKLDEEGRIIVAENVKLIITSSIDSFNQEVITSE